MVAENVRCFPCERPHREFTADIHPCPHEFFIFHGVAVHVFTAQVQANTDHRYKKINNKEYYMIVRKVWKNQSNNQLLITIPKDSDIQDGDYVKVGKVAEDD